MPVGIRISLGLVLTVLILTGLVSVAVTIGAVRSQASDAVVINLVGRQRALSQRVAKLTLLDAARGGLSPHRVQIRRTADEWEHVFHAQRDGGQVVYGQRMVSFRPETDPTLRARLERVWRAWQPFRSAAEAVLENQPGSPAFARGLADLELFSDSILREMDQVVQLYEAAATARTAGVEQIQWVCLSTGALVVAFAFWLIRWQIVRPLGALGTAVRRIAAGDLSFPIPVTIHNEVGEVAATMDEMRQRLCQRFTEQAGLLKLSQDLAGFLSADEILEHTVATARKLLNSDFAGILLPLTDGSLQVSSTVGCEANALKDLRIDLAHESIAGRAFTTRTPSWVADAAKEIRPAIFPRVLQAGLNAALAVPMFAQADLIGVLTVEQRTPREYSADDVRLTSLIASQASLAYKTALLHTQSEERLERICSLHDIDVAISGVLNLGERLDVLLRKVTEHLRVDGAAIALIDPETRALKYAARYGFDEEFFIDGLLREGDGIAGWVASTGQVVVIPDVRTEQRFLRRSIAERLGINSYMAGPLRMGSGIIGVLELATRERHYFSPEEVDFFETLAGQAAVAIDNSRLFEELRLCRDAFHYTLDAVCIADMTGHILNINPAFERIMGFSLAEVRGKSMRVVKSQHTTREFYQKMWSQLLNHGHWAGEIINRRKNGEEWNASLTISTVKNERGQPIAYIGIHRDITDINRNVELIRRGKLEWEAAFDAVTDLILLTDNEERITRCNRAVMRRFGYDYGDIVGRTLRELFFGTAAPEGRAIPKPTDSSGLVEEMQFPSLPGWYKIVGYSMLSSHGDRGVGRVYVMTDVTTNKAAEDERRQLSTAIENSEEAMVILETDGCVRYVNPSFERITGFPPVEILGIRPFFWMAEAADGENSQRLQIAIEDQVAWRGDLRIVRKDGTTRDLEVGLSCIQDGAGSYAGAVVFLRDVTEDLEFRRNTERMREMERLGSLVGGVAHEVRNPLNAIQATTQALRLDLGEDPEHKLLFDVIQTQVDRLSTLMKELLELGRPVVHTSMTLVEIGTFLKETLALWQQTHPAIDPKSMQLLQSESATAQVQMDRARLQQVFMNVLDNAVQGSDMGVDIRISVEERVTECRITISDHGKGAPEEHISRLFEPFFTMRRGGTGLGLSIVKHIVEEHRGQVRLWNNVPPPGCTVEVILPKAAPDGQAGPEGGS